MKRVVKYLLLVLVIFIVGYQSVYFKRLSNVKKDDSEAFDAPAFAKKMWEGALPAKLDTAIALTDLITAIQTDPSAAFQQYTYALGIGNYRYSLVKLTGTAAVIHEDDILLQVNHADSLMTVKLATEYVYGNAIRDASGLIDIKDFTNTTDLNNISEALNKTVRSHILPPFKKAVKQGDTIEVVGAVEINKEHTRLNELEVIPVRLNILPK